MTDYIWWNKSPPVVCTPWIQWVLVVVVMVVLFEEHHVMLRRKGLLVMFGFWLECHEARPTCSCWGSLSGSLRCRWWQSRSPPTETDAWLEGMTKRRWSTIQHQGKRWLPSRGRERYVSLNLGRVWSAEWRVQRVYCLMVWSQLQECPDMISVWELAEWLALVSACERERRMRILFACKCVVCRCVANYSSRNFNWTLVSVEWQKDGNENQFQIGPVF